MFSSLRKNIEIIKVIKEGKKNYSKDFTVFYLKDHNQNKCKVVISISKKFFKLAVKRNKIRRQIKAIFIETKILDSYNNYSFVIVIKQTYDVTKYLVNKQKIVKNINSIGG